MRSRCYQWSVSRAIALPSALPYASAIDSVSTLSKGNHEGYSSHAVQNGTMVTPFTAPLIALSRGNVAVDRRPELLAEGPESPQLSCASGASFYFTFDSNIAILVVNRYLGTGANNSLFLEYLSLTITIPFIV